MRYFVIFLPVFSMLAKVTHAQECIQPSSCVEEDDLAIMLDTLREKKCLLTQSPELTSTPITITADDEGRVFVSGKTPHPYKTVLEWCGYRVESVGELKVVVAKKIPKEYGFRIRPKFSSRVLFGDAVTRNFGSSIDVGLSLDFFHYKMWNVQVDAGYRSIGMSLGMDITRNFGVTAGYAFSFWTLGHNPIMGAYFAF